jgi:catechol 2,3-dioxygenase-like lactoylglutathione lyase family enzyme
VGGDVGRTADFYRNLLGLTLVELPRDRDSYDTAIATLQDHWATSTTSSLMTRIRRAPRVAGESTRLRTPRLSRGRHRGGAGAPRRRGHPLQRLGEWAIKGWHQLFCVDSDGRVLEFHQVLDGADGGAGDTLEQT